MITLMVYLGLVLIGLLLGSFVNALVWRIYRQAELGEKKKLTASEKAEQQKLSISKGRSMCTHCGHQLAAKDLVPVLSWLMLRGKCRYCHKPIADTPISELVLPLLLVVSYIFWPHLAYGWNGLEIISFGIWTLVLVCFTALALYDAKWYLLPNRIVWPLTLLSLIFVLIRAAVQMDAALVVWALLGAATISGIFKVLSVISKGEWIGGGDIKLGFSLGLLVGAPVPALFVLFVASLLGTLAALPSLLTKKRDFRSMLPFGPFLIAATIIVFLFGDVMLGWYISLLEH